MGLDGTREESVAREALVLPELKETGVNLTIQLPVKVVEIVRKLMEKGDYKSISDFVCEASRSHLNTWYPETWNPKGA